MYNTQFKVKYNDIESELIHKLKNTKGYDTENSEYLNNPSEINKYGYNSQDVLDICNKLYRDELLSVFYADTLIDDKIDNGMKYIYKIMMQNEHFKKNICHLEETYFQNFIKNEEISLEKQTSIRQLILIILFSQQVFYITHKCICQQIELNIIDEELLVELRDKTMELLLLNININ